MAAKIQIFIEELRFKPQTRADAAKISHPNGNKMILKKHLQTSVEKPQSTFGLDDYAAICVYNSHTRHIESDFTTLCKSLYHHQSV